MRDQQQLNLNELWYAWSKNKDKDAYLKLVDNYLSLVDRVVKKMKPSLSNQVSFDELKSSGMIGFLDALNKFDYTRGLQFETYASLRIRGAILDGLRENDWIPRSIRDKSKKIEKAYQELEQIYLRSVTDKEISDYLGMTEDEFYQNLQETSFMSYLSLDDSIDDNKEVTRKSLLTDSIDIIDEKINQQYNKDLLISTINRLPEKEKLVISLYYYEELNFTEISEVLSLSSSRISQLHTKAIYRLRGALSRQKKNLF